MTVNIKHIFASSTQTYISVILAGCPTIEKKGRSLITSDATFRDAPLQVE